MAIFSFENSTGLKKEDIIDFLNRNPEFLIENADRIHLFKSLKYNIFTLAQRYRHENEFLRQTLENFFKIAEENFDLISALFEIDKVLEKSGNFKTAIEFLMNFFKNNFDIDYISLAWCDNNIDFYDDIESFFFIEKKELLELVKYSRKPIIRQRRCKLIMHFINNDDIMDKFGSAVVIPLWHNELLLGALSLISFQSDKFHSKLSDDFIVKTSKTLALNLYYLLLKEKFIKLDENLTKKDFLDFLYLYDRIYNFAGKSNIFEFDISENINLQDKKDKFHSFDILFKIENKGYFFSVSDLFNDEKIIEKIKEIFAVSNVKVIDLKNFLNSF